MVLWGLRSDRRRERVWHTSAALFAAAGLAQFNALGNLAGFVGPFLLGWIKEATGSYALGMLPMIAQAVTGAVAVLFQGRRMAVATVPA